MTNDDKRKLYQLLSAAFPEAAIERTDGRITGKGYSTTGIKAQFVINRLNDVLGVGGWRAHREITVKEITTSSGRKAYEAICDLVLEIGEWVDGKFVCVAESLADGGHTSTSEADAKKGSFSNALKKGAAMFGCGRQAYQILTKTKKAAIYIEELRRDEQDEADFLNLAVGVLKAIDAGISYPQRGWQCRSCAYQAACSSKR